MDDEIDPCEDFNKFACGGFDEKTIIPDDKSGWQPANIIMETIESEGRKLIEEPINDKKDFESYKKAKNYYKLCMDEEKQDAIGVKPLMEILSKLGGWPLLEGDAWDGEQFNIWNLSIKLKHLGLSSDYFASVGIANDDRNNSFNVIHFGSSSLGLPKAFWDRGVNEPVVQAYFQAMIDVAVHLGAEENKAKEELQKVFEFEMQLANISLSREDLRNKTKLYNPITLAQFPVSEELPQSWTMYLQKLYDFGNEKLDIQETERVIIVDVDFYKNLSRILQNTDKRTLANYVGWRVAVQSQSSLGSKERAILQKFLKVLSGVDQKESRWKTCLTQVGFNSGSGAFLYAVSSMYARFIFNANSKVQVLDMTHYLRRAFAKILDESEWMDDETKNEARKKLSNMKQFIAYPDEVLIKEKVDGFYAGLDLDKEDYFGNELKINKYHEKYNDLQLREVIDPNDWKKQLVAIVNAFYDPSKNAFLFPAGILQGNYSASSNILLRNLQYNI
jgi:predicted metalloendopeptidase